MRIFLLAPPWGHIYGGLRHVAKAGVSYPPLGLCYVAGGLRDAGHEVRVVDAEAEAMDLGRVLEEIEGFGPDLVGVQVASPQWDVVRDICRAVRERRGDASIVLGGPHISLVKAEAFEQNPHFDYGVVGEGERTMCELAERLEGGGSLAAVDGLLYRDGGEIRETAPRSTAGDLDDYPLADRSDLPMDRYMFSVPGRGYRRSTTLSSSRGCPFECTFCTEPMLVGRSTRFRSPESVVDEIHDTKERYGVTHFCFVDDTLTLQKPRIHEMCRLIRDRGLDITMEGWTHANTVDEELLREMRSAGFVRLSFGVESGNPGILKSLKKGTDHERIRADYRAAKKVGLETRGSVLIGLPGDTRATVEETIRFVCELKELDHCYFNIAMPYPGTEIRKLALRGERGVRLLSNEYSEMRRQGQSVVMEVNDLDADTLLALQRKAYRSFWLRPHRVRYNLFRAGPYAALVNGWAFFRSFILPAPRRRHPPKMTFQSEITSVADRARP